MNRKPNSRKAWATGAGVRVASVLTAGLVIFLVGGIAQVWAAPPAPVQLHVMVNKSLVVQSPARLKRVSVTDPTVADALVVTPNQVLIQAHAPGEISLVLWDEAEQSTTYDLHVDADLSGLQADITRVFPGEAITVSASRGAIVLSGTVSADEISRQAGDLATGYGKNVINALSVTVPGAQQVLLEVKFAEVDRTALAAAGLNIFSTGSGNTIGAIGTGQFSGPKFGDVTNSTGAQTAPTTTTTSVSNLLNLFLFNPDIHLGAILQALQQRNLLQILAEPNLVATSGKESSFLAGGEFPFPVVQPGGTNAITIQFKEFGIRLKFTPQLRANGNIHLRVAPEVSSLDFADGLTIQGNTVPALTTRRAESEFEMLDGQSFIIAGLMDNRVTKLNNRIPGLGNLPVLGALFRSESFQRTNTELVVLVTARRITASSGSPALPVQPVPFMDKGQFDSHQPGAPGSNSGSKPSSNSAKPPDGNLPETPKSPKP